MGNVAKWALGLVAAVLLSSCGDSIGEGEPCFDTEECAGDSVCASTVGGNFCMNRCSSDIVICEDRQACVQAEEDAALYVCLPGGETPVGNACTTSFQCTLGAICAEVDGEFLCAQICDPAFVQGCPLEEACVPLDDESRGICRVVAETAD